MRIGVPARKRGIADEDMLHAWRNAIRRIDKDDRMTLFIGPDTAGRMLEIGILGLDSDDPVIIHAMPLRPTFHRFL